MYRLVLTFASMTNYTVHRRAWSYSVWTLYIRVWASTSRVSGFQMTASHFKLAAKQKRQLRIVFAVQVPCGTQVISSSIWHWLAATGKICPLANSFQGFLCLQVYQLQPECTAKCEDLQYICTLDFKTHFKLVVFLGIRRGTMTSWLWIPKNTTNSIIIWTAKSILFSRSIHFPPF
jgi:hypothetical protein